MVFDSVRTIVTITERRGGIIIFKKCTTASNLKVSDYLRNILPTNVKFKIFKYLNIFVGENFNIHIRRSGIWYRIF